MISESIKLFKMFLSIPVNPLILFVIATCSAVINIKWDNLNENLQISTEKGIAQGRKTTTYNLKEYWAFQGIPYARPPIGSLRFRRPKPVEPWQGVLDATKDGPSCVEVFVRGTNISVNGTEDCLYLNVFIAQDPQTIIEPLPVLVWIHGGAFIEGNSSSSVFGPDFLLQQNIVVVTINYRVGMFGFLSTGDSACPGNFGLKDQNLALRWVQTNIRKFGGDKNRVTIFGQSAGAASVIYHLTSQKSKGLFHRAIANSGSSLATFAYYKHSRQEVAFQIGEAAGINARNSKELISKLRKTNSEKLKTISRTLVLLSLVRLHQLGFPFTPTVEPNHKDAFITESSYTLLENGNFNKVPVIMGFNSLESIFFANFLDFIKPLTLLYDLSPGSFANPSMNIRTFEEKRKVGALIKQHYFLGQSALEATDDEVLNYVSDDQFIRPIRKTVQLICKYTPVYLYLFSYQSDYGIKGFDDVIKGSEKGISHSEELSYFWKRDRQPPPKGLDELTILRVVKLWANFIKTGYPTPVKDKLLQNVTWPTVKSPSKLNYLQIDVNLSVKQNFREEHMRFWDNLYAKYGNKPFVTY